MSFFTQLASVVANNLAQNLVNSFTSSATDPLKVIEVNSSNFVSRSVIKREQCVVMHGPGGGSEGYELVVIVLVNGNRDKVFSLCRSAEMGLVDHHFIIAKENLPTISRFAPEFCLLPKLQELWSLITSNPGWNTAHIVSHYGLNDGLKDPTVLALLSVCDETNEMTPLHVAAKNGRTDFIRTVIASVPIGGVHFDARDAKGNSIYHYAAQANKETIEVLAFCELSNLLNSLNEDGQTPLHVACQSDKPDCVKALIAAGADINAPSTGGREGSFVDGATRGHRRAGSTGTAQSAKDILTAFPNQLHTKDMKNGGTPLHWCTTREVVAALVELADCRIDARNFSGQTALHVMVQRERFECVVALLSRGADPNLTDSSGNAPLHEAVSFSSPSATHLLIVQALIAFRADVNMLNDQGESPRHRAARRSGTGNGGAILYALHAVGAKRCAERTAGCSDGCSPTGKEDGLQPVADAIPRSRHLFDAMLKSVCQHSAVANQKGNYRRTSTVGGRVLCLDGGGIRGLVLIQMLEALEYYLGGPVLNHFDWISGTSTGGILALALASGKSTQACKSLYFCFKDKVFVGKRPYDADALEGFLREEFGTRTMADLSSGPKILVTAVAADTIPADLHFFRNYPSPQDLLSLPDATGKMGSSNKKAEEQMIWQAARASGAAPTYFRAFGSFLDGGLIANNPTLDVLTEIQEHGAVLNALGAGGAVQPTVVVSLGTGCKPAEQVDTLDLFRPESLLDTARLAFGVSAFGKLLVDQVTSSDRRVVDRARAWCTNIGAAYYRLSPLFTRDVALDESKTDQLINMLWETQAYIHSHQADFKQIAQLLKSK